MLSAISALDFQQSPIFFIRFSDLFKIQFRQNTMAGNINDSRTVKRIVPILFLIAKEVLNFLVFEDIRSKIIGIVNIQDNAADKFSMPCISYIGNFRLILL